MTIADTHTNIRFYLDKLETSALPDITKEGIDLAINNALETYIKNKYKTVQQLSLRNEGFESVQKRIDDLRVLVTTSTLSLQDDSNDTSLAFVDLTNVGNDIQYQFYLRGQVKIADSFTGIKIIKHDNLEVIKLDPFNQSIDRKPRGFFEGERLYIIKSENISDEFKLTFLRRFKEVNLDSNIGIELSEHTHREVVQLTVQQLLEVVESERVVTNQEKVISSE